MDANVIKAIVNAANGRNIEIRSTDASIINTKSKGTYCSFNYDKGCVVCLRSNDNASTHIKKPLEVTTWDFNDINHMTITGDMVDTKTLLAAYKSAGLITAADLTNFENEMVKNESLKAHNATTSIENYDESAGYKVPVRNASGYGNVERERSDEKKRVEPEIVNLGE